MAETLKPSLDHGSANAAGSAPLPLPADDYATLPRVLGRTTIFRPRKMLIISRCVAKYYRVNHRALRVRKRNPDKVLARHVAMYLIRLLLDSSAQNIALHFNRTDHTTALHAVRKIHALRAENAKIAEDIRNLIQQITKQLGMTPARPALA